MEQQPQLENTIPEKSGGNYEMLPEGDHLMGLVLIKNKEMTNSKTGEKYPGFQLSFRSKDNPKAWVNRKFKASTFEKSAMFTLLKVMTKGKVKKDISRDEIFAAMLSCLGHWYDVTVEHNPWKDTIFVNVSGDLVIPNLSADKELGDAVKYFTALDEGTDSDGPNI